MQYKFWGAFSALIFFSSPNLHLITEALIFFSSPQTFSGLLTHNENQSLLLIPSLPMLLKRV